MFRGRGLVGKVQNPNGVRSRRESLSVAGSYFLHVLNNLWPSEKKKSDPSSVLMGDFAQLHGLTAAASFLFTSPFVENLLFITAIAENAASTRYDVIKRNAAGSNVGGIDSLQLVSSASGRNRASLVSLEN